VYLCILYLGEDLHLELGRRVGAEPRGARHGARVEPVEVREGEHAGLAQRGLEPSHAAVVLYS